MQDGHLTKKIRTYSFHRRAAGSSRRGLTGTWGSRVPPGHSRGHTGRWCELPGPARCGTWSSSRSGSLANLGTSHFGTPLWKEKEKKKIKQAEMEVFRGVYSAAFHGSCKGPWGEHRYISFRRDAATHFSACGLVARRLMHSYCMLAWPCDRMTDFIWVGRHSNIIADAAVPRNPSGFNHKQSQAQLLQPVSQLSD